MAAAREDRAYLTQELIKRVTSGSKINDAARELGVPFSTAQRWVTYDSKVSRPKCVDRDTLSSLVEQGLSISKIANALGESKRKVTLSLTQYGLKTRGTSGPKRSRPRNSCKRCGQMCQPCNTVYCSAFCRKAHRFELDLEYIKAWLRGEASGARPDGAMRSVVVRFIRNFAGSQQCWECGWDRINPNHGSVPTQIDHIDGNDRNHAPGNLRLLCPNCHSLTPTYCGLNKKNNQRAVAKLG